MRRAVPEERVDQVRALATRAVRPWARRRLDGLDEPLLLHLACGARRLPGWLNVDLVGTGADAPWDLRHRLPLADESCDAIFHEHFLEHLSIDAALAITRECRRLLRPGGVLRIGVPDFRRYVESYMGDGAYISDLRAGCPSTLLAVTEVVYDRGHRSMWDEATLRLLLEEVGFSDVRVVDGPDSKLSPAPDAPHRSRGTLYVEALG